MRRIGITIGDPAGIGPEITVKAIEQCQRDDIWPVVIGDRSIVAEAFDRYGKGWELQDADFHQSIAPRRSTVDVVDVPTPEARDLPSGQLHPENGRAMLAYATRGIKLAQDGDLDGIIGGPHNKEAVVKAGVKFNGYPNLVANSTGAKHAFLMLVGKSFRVVAVTLHMPLVKACQVLDRDIIIAAVESANSALQRLGIGKPRIAVAGLNPHAGEGGAFGSEEQDFIVPALQALREQNVDVHGPFAADSMFAPTHRGSFDAYVGMYHDQAHLAIKAIEFHKIISLVIGPPILFATVGHGSAYDIAGNGIADPSSLVRTIKVISSVGV